MPANMMIEPVGSSLKVTGSSNATVSDGLMPGRMPTSVPSNTPMPANNRLPGCAATSRPWPSAVKISPMSGEQPFERAGRQAERQRLGEEEVHHCRQQRADAIDLRPSGAPKPRAVSANSQAEAAM